MLEQDQQADKSSTALPSSSFDLGDYLQENADMDGHEAGQVDLEQLGSLESHRAVHNYYVDAFASGDHVLFLTDQEVEVLVGQGLLAEYQKEATDIV